MQIMDLGEEEDTTAPTNTNAVFSTGLASAFSGVVSSAFSGNTKRSTPADAAAAAAGTSSRSDHDGAGPSPPASASPHRTDDGDAHRGAATAAAAPVEDAATLQLRHSLQQQKKRYDDLLADSHALRSEYDAYQLRMDRAMRQYKQQALQDKHMLEELRLAGATGSMDEAYVTGMKRQIAELQRQLKESMTAAEKAYQRQREAEEARASTEKAKREELEALASAIAQLSTTTTQSSSAVEVVAGEASEATDAPASSAGVTTSGTAAEEASASPVAAAPAAERIKESGEEGSHHTTASPEQVKVQAQLALRQAEVAELRAQLQQASATHLQVMEERAEDIATLRTEIDQREQRESALKAAHAAAIKRTEAEFAEKEAALRRDLEAAREQMQQASAEQSSKRMAQELLAVQEREHEERMHAKEREMQSLRASLQALQSAVEATHGELREMEMTLHDAQQENQQLQGKADQASTDLLRSEQQLAQREDALLDAEKERQRLRAMLRQEEEETLRVRQQLTQLQRVEAERGVTATATTHRDSADNAPHDSGSAAADEDGDASRLSSVVQTQRQTIQALQSRVEALESDLTTREVALRRQQAQAQEISTARIEFMKSKEEANARVEQFREKVRRLEGELAVARRSGAAADAAAFGTDEGRSALDVAGGLSASVERRQFLLEAKRSADSYRISRVRQMRAAFFAVLLLVVGMTLYAAFSLAPSPPERFD